jgi:predicted transcriptional regulator
MNGADEENLRIRQTGMTANRANLIENTADIIVAYVGNNSISREDLPGLIRSVHRELASAGLAEAPKPKRPAPKPAVPIKDSVSADTIICLEDGQSFRCLTKHLWSKYRMTPGDYRTKWGLAANYPMTAPNYSALRAEMAREMGLGRGRAAKAGGKGARSRSELAG